MSGLNSLEMSAWSWKLWEGKSDESGRPDRDESVGTRCAFGDEAGVGRRTSAVGGGGVAEVERTAGTTVATAPGGRRRRRGDAQAAGPAVESTQGQRPAADGAGEVS